MSRAEPGVRAIGLGKCFKLYDSPYDRLREWLSFGRRVLHRPIWALRGVDLVLGPGECLGVIGANGAGKSTMLKLLSGSLTPTEGRVEIHGRCLALIELNAGFDLRLTGRQNIAYVGEMLGLDAGYVAARTDDIVAFADLGQYVDQPTRTYSSGMFARLSFAMYAFLEPDVLMIDEVLAVGDAAFKRKCFDLIENMVRQEHRATIYVSHGMQTVARLATRVLWIDRGEVRSVGEPVEVINAYLAHAGQRTLAGPGADRPAPRPHGSVAGGVAGDVAPEPPPRSARPLPVSRLLLDRRGTAAPDDAQSRVLAVWLENDRGEVVDVAYAHTPVVVAFAVEFLTDLRTPGFRLDIRDESGAEVDACDTRDFSIATPEYRAGQTQVVRVTVRRGLPSARYRLVPSARAADDGTSITPEDAATMTCVAFPGATGQPPRFAAPQLDAPLESPESDGANQAGPLPEPSRRATHGAAGEGPPSAPPLTPPHR